MQSQRVIPQVMLGYYKNPEATAEVLQEGWLRTGDVVKIDADNALCVVEKRGPKMFNFELLFLHGFSSKSCLNSSRI